MTWDAYKRLMAEFKDLKSSRPDLVEILAFLERFRKEVEAQKKDDGKRSAS
jgi:hypothetical protein